MPIGAHGAGLSSLPLDAVGLQNEHHRLFRLHGGVLQSLKELPTRVSHAGGALTAVWAADLVVTGVGVDQQRPLCIVEDV